jgi:hypothetical protein
MDIQITQDDILRIATCSDDRTVKFWNMKLEDFQGVNNNKGKYNLFNHVEPRKIGHIAYSKLLRRIFYFGKTFDHFKFNLSELTDKHKDEDIHLDIGKAKFNLRRGRNCLCKIHPR